MVEWLHGLLAIAVVDAAVGAVTARALRWRLVSLAVTLSGVAAVALSVQLSCLALGASLAAVAAAIWALGRWHFPDPGPGADGVALPEGTAVAGRTTTALALAGLWAILVGSVLWTASSPFWGAPPPSADSPALIEGAVSALLATRYAPALAGLALTALSVLVGGTVWEGEA